ALFTPSCRTWSPLTDPQARRLGLVVPRGRAPVTRLLGAACGRARRHHGHWRGSMRLREEEAEEKHREEVDTGAAPEGMERELFSHEIPAGPTGRGGSLEPRDLCEEVDESSDESFP